MVPYLMASCTFRETEIIAQMGKISILDADVTATIALGFL